MRKNNRVSVFSVMYEILSFCFIVVVFVLSFYAIANYLDYDRFQLPFFEKILSSLPF